METERDETLSQPIRSKWPVPQIDTILCDGCNLCVRVCPNQVLRLEDGMAVVAFPDRCNYTGLCEKVCPKGAIQRIFEIVWPGEASSQEISDVKKDSTGKDP